MEFIKIVLFLFVVNKNLLKKKEQNLIFFSCGSINLLGKTALWNFISKRINGTPKRIYCKRNLQVRCFKLSMQYKRAFKKKKILSGLDLTTRDSYFTIPVEVFTNRNLVENIFHESYGVNRTLDYGLQNWK